MRPAPLALLLLACAPTGDAPVDDTDDAPDDTDDTDVAVETDDTDLPDETDETDETDAPGPRWDTIARLLAPRQEHGLGWLGDELVLVGGFVDGAPTASVEAWSATTGTWRSLRRLPQPLHHANVAEVGGVLYVLGGLQGDSPDRFAARGSVLAYDADDDLWSPRTLMPDGTQRGASAVFVLDERIHVVGGLGGAGAATAHHAYDPEADAWESIGTLGTGRDHAVGAWIDGVFYLAGGRDVSPARNVADVEAWDPENGWRSVQALPRARGGAAGGVLGGRLWVLGGEEADDDGARMQADVTVFDPVSNTWTAADPMPTPVHGAPGAVRDGRILVPGGGVSAGLDPTDALLAFDPEGI